MSFTLKSAVREKIGLLFAIAGASGSGKTFSALRLGRGLAGEKGKIAVIDTEAGRALHYAPPPGEKASEKDGTFDFFHLDFAPPFTPDRYIEAIRVCEKAGADVIIIDSMSHEWNGEGGCSDMADEIATIAAIDRQTGKLNIRKKESMSFVSWKKPKACHKRMMNQLIQTRTHIIFCLRAEEKFNFGHDENGKTQIVAVGFQPICEKSFMFEMTASMILLPSNPGVPDYKSQNKMNDAMRKIFPAGHKITSEQGEQLKRWSEVGNEKPIDKALNYVQDMINRLNDVKNVQELEEFTSDKNFVSNRNRLKASRPELEERLQNTINELLEKFDNEPETEIEAA